MTLLLDTGALVKLVAVEAETAALRRFLRGQQRVSACALVRTELRRTVLRRSPDLLEPARLVLAGLFLVQLDAALLDAAGTLASPALRSLDAIHLAAAMRTAPGDAVVTYDERRAAAATSLGLVTAAPA